MSGSVYLFFGNDDFMVSSKARETIDAIVPRQDQTFGLEIIDGHADNKDGAMAAIGRCMGSLKTVDFFAAATKVTWLRDVNYLVDNQTGKTEDVKSRVRELADFIKAGLADGQALVVTATGCDKRHSFYKTCEKAGKVAEFSFEDKPWEQDKGAMGRLDVLVTERGLKMGRDAKLAFLDLVGSDTRFMSMELEKLETYAGAKSIALADVNAIVSTSRAATGWQLADMFGARNFDGATAVLRQLLFQNESAMGIIFQLETRVRELLVCREALDRKWLVARQNDSSWSKVPPSAEMLLSSFKKDPRQLNSYRMAKVAEQAARFSLAELRACLNVVIDAHQRLVSTRIPEQTVLEVMLVKLFRKKAAARPAPARQSA